MVGSIEKDILIRGTPDPRLQEVNNSYSSLDRHVGVWCKLIMFPGDSMLNVVFKNIQIFKTLKSLDSHGLVEADDVPSVKTFP